MNRFFSTASSAMIRACEEGVSSEPEPQGVSVSQSRNGAPPQRPLAMIVDITGTTPRYDAALSKALIDYPEVLFRSCPFFIDPDAPDSPMRKDLLRTAGWLKERWPGVVRRSWLWRILQLHGYLAGCRDIMREIRRKRIPVLHFQWCKIPVFDVWLMRRAQKKGIRVVYTVHNALPHGDRRESVRRSYQKLYVQADALVVLSRFVGQQVIDWVDPSLEPKIHVIEHGILELDCPLPDRQKARAELGLERDAQVAVFIGTIRSYKGISDLIDAIGIACRTQPKLRLIIAGSPQEAFGPYQDQIERLGLTPFIQAYPKYVSEQFKATLYAAADIAILPHRDPSQSAMGLEALAAGKPIIVTRGGGLVELVDEGVNGYSVPIKDPAKLAEALDRFFSLSSVAQEAMAAASVALGKERFAWPVIARKHLKLYLRLSERTQTQPAMTRV